MAKHPEKIDPIAKHQFEIAQYLLRHPEAKVFAEGIAVHPHNIAYKSQTDRFEFDFDVKNRFRDGLPSKFEDLDSQQRFLLAKHGAAKVLYVIRELKELWGADLDYPALRELNRRVAAAVEKWGSMGRALHEESALFQEISTRREEIATSSIIDMITSLNRWPRDQPTPILLIYGANHRFDRYFESADATFSEMKTTELSQH